EWLDGSVHLYWHENELAYRALAEKPISPRMSCHPPSTHPWRNKPLGKAKLLPAFSKIDSQHFVSSP
ncbi:MAG: hypothetical protein KGZ58_06565, partial [Ignavibacteriales bacterium]|nr:hypothetical protein [Ignavibacteriales bacterium]